MSSSPARELWRSLRGDPLALIGLAIVVLITLACVCAPLLSPHDPQLLREWLGAHGPGFTHPDCVDRNELAAGQRVAWCRVPHGAGELTLRAAETVAQTYRVAVRRGSLEIRTANAERVEALDLHDRRAVVRVPGGDDGQPAPAIELKWGQTPPEGFFPPGPQVVEVVVTERSAEARYAARVEDGVARSVTHDNAPVDATVTVRGENVIAVLWKGADGAERELRSRHWLGTDRGGRDLLTRVLFGGRVSLMVGAVATLVSLVIGVLYGATAGFLGGRADRLMMAGVDVLYAIPFMFLVILLLVHVGRSIFVLFAALGAVQWLTMARIVRGQVLSLMGREFVLAARAGGVGSGRIILRHLIPNTAGLVAVYAALTVPAVILEESFLAFIGLAVQHDGQNLDSWGALVKVGVDTLDYHSGDAWWLLVFPAAAMVLTLLALNVLGESLRDAVDPRARR